MRPALRPLALALCTGLLAGCASTPTASSVPAAKPMTMQDVLDAATPADWRTPDPEFTVYLQLANGGRAVIELAPQFAPKHVANIQQLLREGYFDGLAIVRSQDNFVVQWGDPDADEAGKARTLKQAAETLPAEFTVPAAGLDFTRLKDVDGWAPEVGFVDGFPAARNPKEGVAWLAHCYGNVGAGRGGAPDSSNGSSLYVVTGQSPRQLDRNITSVGRVIAGMEWLSVLPRGGGPLGFYEKPEQRTGIVGMRLASDLPADQRLPLQVLRTDTATWDKLVEARRNRRDDWYVHPAGHIDLCNVPVPVRMKP